MFSTFLTIGLILSIGLLVLFCKTKNTLYWNLFLSLIICRLATTNFLYTRLVSDDAVDLGDGLMLIGATAIAYISSIILLIIGIKKKKEYKVSAKLDRNFFLMSAGYILIGSMLFFIIPGISTANINKKITKNVTNYFEENFNDYSVEVVRIDKDFSYNGIVQSYHTGYEVTIKTDLVDKDCRVYTDLDGNMSHLEYSFLDKYFYKKYGYTNTYDTYYEAADKSYMIYMIIDSYISDHLPTLNEVIENGDVYLDIYVDEDTALEYDNYYERIKFIAETSIKALNNMEITKDFSFEFIGLRTFTYKVTKENNTLTISGYDFDPDDLNQNHEYKTYVYNIDTKNIIEIEEGE